LKFHNEDKDSYSEHAYNEDALTYYNLRCAYYRISDIKARSWIRAKKTLASFVVIDQTALSVFNLILQC